MKKHFIGSVLGLLLLAACAVSEATQELGLSPQADQPLAGDTTPTMQEIASRPLRTELLVEKTPSVSQAIELIVKSKRLGGIPHSIHVKAPYAYVGIPNRLMIFDVTEPAKPSIVGSKMLSHINNEPVLDIYVSGDYAYLANWVNGLIIVDISDPTQPAVVGRVKDDIQADPSHHVFRFVQDVVTVEDNYVYIVELQCHSPCTEQMYRPSLRVIDISDPTNPKVISSIEGLSYNMVASAVSGYALMSDPEGNLQIVDLADPLNPYEVQVLEFPAWISEIATTGDLAYILSDGKVFVMDVSDPENPIEITAFEYADEFWRPGITAVGKHVYIYNRHVPGAVYWPYSPPERQLIQIFDFSEATDPRLVASYDQPGTLIALDVEGKFVFVTVDDNLMAVLGLNEEMFPQNRPTSPSDESMVQELEGASHSQAGVTVEVLRVEYLNNKTIVDFRVSVDSRWKFTNGESIPPKQALVYPTLVDDRGNTIAGHSLTSDLGTFYPGGSASFTNRSIFDPIPQDAKTLTLGIDTTTLTEIPGEEIFKLDLTGREPGDSWRIDETLSVGGIPFTITEVRLDLAESGDKQLRLEFVTDSPIVIEPIGMIGSTISVQSLYIFESNYSMIEMADTGRFDASYDSQDRKIVAVYEFGTDTRIVKTPLSIPEGTIEYKIVGYIIVAGPWEITWEVEIPD